MSCLQEAAVAGSPPRRCCHPWETLLAEGNDAALPTGEQLAESQQAGWEILAKKQGLREPLRKQGCLSVSGEQMGTMVFVAAYLTCQLSCNTKASVTQQRWPGLVRGRSATACVAQLLAWLLRRGCLMWLRSGEAGNCLPGQSFVSELLGTASTFCFLLG